MEMNQNPAYWDQMSNSQKHHYGTMSGSQQQQFGQRFEEGGSSYNQNGMPPDDGDQSGGMPPAENGGIDPATGQPYANDPINGNNPNSPWTNYGSPEYTQNQGSSWNGQPTAGARAGDADYAGVERFSDAAYDNARRYLDPQQAFDNRRFDQELVNRGIDPMSDYGRQMSDQMAREHGDQDQGAAFGAMGFGQGIQDQMFRQNFDNTRQAGDMQKAQWGDDTNRYMSDQAYNSNMGRLELDRQGQDFSELVGYDSMQYRDDQFNEMNRRWDQDLAMRMAGSQPPYGSRDGGGSGEGGSSIEPIGDWWAEMRKEYDW